MNKTEKNKEKKMRKSISICFMFLISLTINGCMQNSMNLAGNKDIVSYGMAKKELKIGITTQKNVLEMFGGPNITTKGSSMGQEVWTYEKISIKNLKSVFGIGLSALGGANAIGGMFGGNIHRSSTETSVRTVTLIIKFDKDEIVQDYKVMESNF